MRSLLISANEYERLLKDGNEYEQLLKQGNEYEKLLYEKSKNVLSLMLSEPDFEKDLSGLLAENFNKNYDIYDKAIDRTYLETHIGGAQLHHNLDGSHTIWGAIKAAKEASPDDSDFVATLNAIEHLIRDVTTPSGINPFLGPEMFQSTKDYLLDFGFKKSFINDFLNINAVEIASFTVISIGLLQNWNKTETKKLGEYTGKFLVLAGYAGNPLFGILVPILISMGTIGHLAISKIYNNLFSSEKLEDFFRGYFPYYKSYLEAF